MEDKSKFAEDFNQKMTNLAKNRVFSANVVTRDEYTWKDYESVRPSEAVPKEVRAVIQKCNEAYDKIVMVRQSMDLVSDIACEGIRIQHPSKRIEKLYKEWWDKIGGEQISKMLTLLLYLQGNVIIKRGTAKFNDDYLKNLASGNTIVMADAPSGIGDKFMPSVVNKNEIPWRYTFLNPLTLEVVGGEMAAFVGQVAYQMVVPNSIRDKLKRSDKQLQKILESVDKDFVEKAKSGRIDLDPETLRVFQYRKKDWEIWARPLMECILDDLIVFSKLRLTDQAACDAACNKLRVWRLGSLEHEIMPSEELIQEFQSLLKYNTGGGIKDIVSHPAVDLIETDTNLDKFLGEDKYKQTVRNIRLGLGLPSVFMEEGGAGMTNAHMSVQVLLKRMQYGRKVVMDFWQEELKLVQRALGHQKPATIVFNGIDFADPNAEKAIWIQLADRYLISQEDFREKMGLDNDVTTARVYDEWKQEGKSIPPKAGPWFDANPELSMKKLQLSKQQAQNGSTSENTKPGRPRNARDGQKRKKRQPKPEQTRAMYDEAAKLIKQANPTIDEKLLEKYVYATLFTFSSSNEISLMDAILNADFSVISNMTANGKDEICNILEKINA